MLPLQIKPRSNFIGRKEEQEALAEIGNLSEAAILIVYGRRRVGKTELLEHMYRNRHIVKFEGLEDQPQASQIEHCLSLLSEYTQNSHIKKIKLTQWTEFFDELVPFLSKGRWTLYFEEVQWLANYETSFIAALKYAWDNHLRHNPQLLIVLCGSSPSFMVSQVVQSKALYNRSQYVLHLKEFSLLEMQAFLKTKTNREVLDAALSVGGVPEYLKWVKKESSVFLGLCKNAFRANGFFTTEYDRIFTSSLAHNRNYKSIVDFLSQRRFATRGEIAKSLGRATGGTLTALLNDLELSGLIERYVPFNLNERSLLARYAISDAYLQFYFKFIAPIKQRIANDDFSHNPLLALKMDGYQKWMGFAFERWCRRHHAFFAKILGFEAVQYKAGAFYNRDTQQKDSGYQFDLVFDRDDKVVTLCEIKYLSSPVDASVIAEFEKKLSLFPSMPARSIHKVLITTEGATLALLGRHYFDRIITLSDIFDQKYW